MAGIPVPIFWLMVGMALGAVPFAVFLFVQLRQNTRLLDRIMARSLTEYSTLKRIESGEKKKAADLDDMQPRDPGVAGPRPL